MTRTIQLEMFKNNKIITLSLVCNLFLKLYTYFLSSSPKEGIIKFTNTPLVLLKLGKPNSLCNLLYYMLLFKFFIAVLVKSYHNGAQYKLHLTNSLNNTLVLTVCIKCSFLVFQI